MFSITKLAALLDLFGGAGVPFANRNFIVDPAIESVSGAAVALTPVAAYTQALMFLGNAGTGGAASATYAAMRANPSLLQYLEAAGNAYTHTQTTASTGSTAAWDLPFMTQRVEWLQKLAGKSVTLSGKIWVASGAATIPAVACAQNFGTGGSPSPTVVNHKAVNWILGTLPKRFSVRLDMPSIVGKTLGTNNNDYNSFGFFFPAGWTGTIFVAEMQVELCSPLASNDTTGKGGAPTTFEYRGYQAELARVQRFYETGHQPLWYCDVIPAGGAAAYGGVRFQVPKRAVPAMSIDAQWQYYSLGNNTPFTPTLGAYQDQMTFNGTQLTNWRGWTGQGSWFADARL